MRHEDNHSVSKSNVTVSHATYVSYTIGFAMSVVWTLLAYVIVVGDLLPEGLTIAAIAGLAVVQLITQLVFFIHLGRGTDARWNVASFFFMLIVLIIIVAGSIWIMNSLNYNMMTPEQMDAYMSEQKDKGF